MSPRRGHQRLGLLLAALAAAAPAAAAAAQDSAAEKRRRAQEEVLWTCRPVDAVYGFLFEGPFDRPSGLSYDPIAQELVVLDIDQERVGIYTRDLLPKFSFGGWSSLPNSRAILAAPNGDYYALFARGDAIRVFNYRGEWQRDVVVNVADGPPVLTSLDWSPEGLLLVGESKSGQLLAVDPATGEEAWSFGTRGYGPGRFGTIAGAAFSPDGTLLYVLDSSTPPSQDEQDRASVVQAFGAQDHRFRFGWGSHGLLRRQFGTPDSIAVAPSGLVLVSDTVRQLVKVFDSQGEFVMEVGGPGGGFGALYFPTDIAVDEDHVLYVAEQLNRRVQSFQLYRDRRREIPLYQPAGKSPSLLGSIDEKEGYESWRAAAAGPGETP